MQNFGGSRSESKASYNHSLAAFLISMNENAVWSFTETLANDGDTWECWNWIKSDGHGADMNRALGEPLHPAMHGCADGHCARAFASGTCSYLAVQSSARDTMSCVWWSDGAVVGDEATCANAALKADACRQGTAIAGTTAGS